jgi:FKBP-type peptidyl-prolyl cis-trans isomerase FklB
MKAGSKYEVYIPQALAYGERAQGQAIKPFSTLVFTIELLEVK